MPRFFPPHLMAPVALLIVILWFMLVHRFRRSPALQQIVAETLGDNTPENALREFELAKLRLAEHLNHHDLDDETRRKIELALGPHREEALESLAELRTY